jgi:DNA primase
MHFINGEYEMVDQTQVDLVNLIGADTYLKKVASTAGGEYHGACPFCGGKDRFRVQPYHQEGGRWGCRQCQRRGDAIAYIRERDGVDFKTAVAMLGLRTSGSTGYTRRVRSRRNQVPSVNKASDLKDDCVALNDPVWQKAACDFWLECGVRMPAPDGKPGWDYLIKRGISPEIIRYHRFGYNPAEYRGQWGSVAVWLPAGIVIPSYTAGQYWTIRVRRMDGGSPKYAQAKGAANGLYFGLHYEKPPITPQDMVVMVEGEFDAAVIHSHVKLPNCSVRAVATGSSTGARLVRWVCELSIARQVLLAFDNDPAGDEAAAWWSEALGDRAVRLRPAAHDVTDMFLSGHNLVEWVARAV